jgi:hypothetical protein
MAVLGRFIAAPVFDLAGHGSARGTAEHARAQIQDPLYMPSAMNALDHSIGAFGLWEQNACMVLGE